MSYYPISNDYAKCEGKNCPKKESCWRYLMPSKSQYQTYLIPNDPQKCDEYWEYKVKRSEK